MAMIRSRSLLASLEQVLRSMGTHLIALATQRLEPRRGIQVTVVFLKGFWGV